VLLAFAGYELANQAIQYYERVLFYRLAEKYAKIVGKPLLVIGKPKGRHGYGDVCVDWDGVDPKCVKEDVQALPYADKQFGACFCSHVLEHVEDATKAYAEMARVADRVWVAYPHAWSAMAWIHPDHRWLVLSTEGKLSAARIGSDADGEEGKVVSVSMAYPPAKIPNLGAVRDQAATFGKGILGGAAMGIGVIGAQWIFSAVSGKPVGLLRG